MDNIYIIRTINLKLKTTTDLEKEFEICKRNNSNWLSKTYDDYVKFLKSWKQDKYSILYEDNVYCESYEIAYEKVINNVCDMNDGGVYNYVGIIRVPLNCCYPISHTTEDDVRLFKFDYDKDTYFEFLGDNEIEFNLLIDKVRGIVKG